MDFRIQHNRQFHIDGYGSVAIVFSSDIGFQKIKYHTDVDIIIAETTNLNSYLTIVSNYFHPFTDWNVFSAELNRLTNFLDIRQYINISYPR